MQALSFLEIHNLAHGALSLTNIWVTKGGKVMIGMLPFFKKCRSYSVQ